jgi:hypothetical protein
MSLRGSFAEATDAYQLPKLIRLDKNLYAACFTLMKMIPRGSSCAGRRSRDASIPAR